MPGRNEPRQIDRRALSDGIAVLRQPALGGARADLAQMAQKVGMVVHLARCAERAERFVADAVDKKTSEPRIRRPRLHQVLEERDRRHLPHEAGVEADLADAVDDGACGPRHFGAHDRVDADHDQVARFRTEVKRRQRRIAGVAAVPVVLAVDLHRLVDLRQGGRGEQHVGRELLVLEHAPQARANVRRADEYARAPGIATQAVEIDALEQAAQRVVVEWIGLVRRPDTREHLVPQEERVVLQVPGARRAQHRGGAKLA